MLCLAFMISEVWYILQQMVLIRCHDYCCDTKPVEDKSQENLFEVFWVMLYYEVRLITIQHNTFYTCCKQWYIDVGMRQRIRSCTWNVGLQFGVGVIVGVCLIIAGGTPANLTYKANGFHMEKGRVQLHGLGHIKHGHRSNPSTRFSAVFWWRENTDLVTNNILCTLTCSDSLSS